MIITEETFQSMAALAKLTFSEKEKKQLLKELNDFVNYIETMKGLNTDGVAPMGNVHAIENVLRKDVVLNKNDKEALLKNAPEQKNGSFMVPKTVD
ncbi:MAG: Asp-tRNA(Asn)/Glu-tRNA(Gln) amidotransferase subunit GatC [Clostridiales bacterium]|nr:Asp-tRNA(Asn)/Glu-tRNA(Gln) amidotransferase subunit GatC [Clostridiales bacterium]